MEQFTLTHDWLAARAAVSPHNLALRTSGEDWSYAELNALTNAASHLLRAAGVAPGDHVAVLLPNCLAFVVMIHALSRASAVLVPLNTRLSADELATQLVHADCTTIITSAALESRISTALLHRCRILVVSEELDELRADRAAIEPEAARLPHGLDATQAIVYTSGTTGRPKGAMLTYSNHFYGALGSAYRLGIMPADRWLACMPLYHVGGLAIVLRSCLYGTAVVLHDGFDPDRVDTALREDGVTIVSLVPTMLFRLLPLAEPARWPTLRLVLLGGAAASASLLQSAESAGIPVATTYGLTEATSQVATLAPDRVAVKMGSVGRPLLFTELRISSDDGSTLAAGEIGEICVRGPGVFAGYFGDEEATAVALRQGELHTGDLGYLDDEGDLWVIQRRSDLIISGGENVYVAEVERTLVQHPAVIEACVVGLPDAEWGQRVAAVVTVRQAVSAEELLSFARDRLAGYKVPRLVRVINSLPLTGSGKVSRAAVIDLLVTTMELAP